MELNPEEQMYVRKALQFYAKTVPLLPGNRSDIEKIIRRLEFAKLGMEV